MFREYSNQDPLNVFDLPQRSTSSSYIDFPAFPTVP